MLSYLVGFVISIAVVIAPIFIMSDDQAIYISIEGIVVVIGGTVGIALSAYPFRRLRHTMNAIVTILRNNVDDPGVIVRECIELTVRTKGDRIALQREVQGIRHPFIRDGVQLIIDKIDNRLEDILVDRIRTRQENGQSIVNVVRTLSKFPPALGLLATVLSLVTLLQNMGGDNAGVANLGPSMAVGLVGTLYGIVLSNLFFSPIAENLAIKSSLDTRNRQIAMVGLLLLKAQESSLVVQESLNAMVEVHQRVDVLGTDAPLAGAA
jgi:chemotaxis protein MotA